GRGGGGGAGVAGVLRQVRLHGPRGGQTAVPGVRPGARHPGRHDQPPRNLGHRPALIPRLSNSPTTPSRPITLSPCHPVTLSSSSRRASSRLFRPPITLLFAGQPSW